MSIIGKEAKYLEVVNWVKKRLDSQELQPGDKLNSENEISSMFGISRQTVRHAIGLLEEEEIVSRVRGSGTYIKDNRLAVLRNRNTVAVVTTYMDSYIFPRIIQGIENVLFEHGYSVQIAFTNNTFSREKMVLEDILCRDEVAGVIIEATKSGLPNPNRGLYKSLIDKKIPLLFINSYYPGLKVHHVSLGDQKAAYEATKMLIEKGHKQIGGIFKSDDGQGHLRYAGYLDAMSEAGLLIDDGRVIWVDTTDIRYLEESYQRIKKRLQMCTAVVCYNDQVAFSLIAGFSKIGIRIPEELSVISIDDSELTTLGEVGITSVSHPKERLGEKAAGNLVQMIRNPGWDGTFEFEPVITVRNSVAEL